MNDVTLRSDSRPQLTSSNNEKAQTVCVIPDPVTNRGIIYQPPYLFETDLYPNYSLLAISIRGYDYVVLEGYFRYIQKLAKSLDLNLSEAYVIYLPPFISHSSSLFSVPIPAKSSRVTILKPRSAQIDVEHHLNLYHRIVKVIKLIVSIIPSSLFLAV